MSKVNDKHKFGFGQKVKVGRDEMIVIGHGVEHEPKKDKDGAIVPDALDLAPRYFVQAIGRDGRLALVRGSWVQENEVSPMPDAGD